MRRRNARGEKVPKVLTPAARVVGPWLEKLGIKTESAAVFEAWDRLLGAEAAKARAAGMKGAVLHVDVDSSARMHDLVLRKPGLVKKLNGYFGARGPMAPPVSDIIFRLSDEDNRRGGR